jgi:hypothetical protein
MSSNVTSDGLLTNYPIAGVDNNSQGFRDNFNVIKIAIDQTRAEFNAFGTHALLKTPLTGTGAVENDIAEGEIINGGYNKFYGRSSSIDRTSEPGTTIDISLYNGVFQNIILSVDSTLTFSHWPAQTNRYACIRLHLTAAQTVTSELTIIDIKSTGNVTAIRDVSFPALAIRNDSYYALEAYSMDAGATVFVKYLGRFEKP